MRRTFHLQRSLLSSISPFRLEKIKLTTIGTLRTSAALLRTLNKLHDKNIFPEYINMKGERWIFWAAQVDDCVFTLSQPVKEDKKHKVNLLQGLQIVLKSECPCHTSLILDALQLKPEQLQPLVNISLFQYI